MTAADKTSERTAAGATLRYGVVGCGRVFQRYHLPCLAVRDDVELVAACDIDVARASAMLTDFPDAFVTSDLHEFLAQAPVDAISVCTPNDGHAEPVFAALDAEVAVLCEKPLATRIEQARDMAARARSARLFGVNLPYRFHELLPAFADIVDGGAAEIEFVFATPGARLWRPYTSWYRDSGRGALLDLGLHALDILVTVFGRPVVRSCVLDGLPVEERALVELSFSDVPATLRIDRASATVRMDVTVRTDNGPAVLDLRRGELRLAGDTVAMARGRPELAALCAFLDAATGDEQARTVSADDALGLQEITEAAYECANQGTGSDEA